MLTNKGKYGLKAIIHLARLEPAETAQVLGRFLPTVPIHIIPRERNWEAFVGLAKALT